MMPTCPWPNCERVTKRRAHGGVVVCSKHHDMFWKGVAALAHVEGPSCLSRHSATIEEIAEFCATGEIPQSRRYSPTEESTRMSCAHCGGPLVLFNGDYPGQGAQATRSDGSPWGVGLCRTCSPAKAAVA